MARPRKSNRHLPPRVYLHHGAYFFVDRAGKWHRLGTSLAEMHRGYAGFIEDRPIRTMNDLFEKYMVEIVPGKAERTQRDNQYEVRFLRVALGRMDPRAFRPRHGYSYYNARKEKSLRRALAEMALLSHIFTKAVEWGVVDKNPCKQVRKERPKPRRRYVTSEEFQAAYSVMPPMFQCAMDLAVLTGLRPGDLLALSRSNLTDEGVLVTTAETGKSLLIEWSEALQNVVDRALGLPPHIRPAIICNRKGRPYTVDGMNSIWYRNTRKAVADNDNALLEPFQFRDLRAKSASDDNLEAAVLRLGHSDPAITNRVYRRKPARVRPLR